MPNLYPPPTPLNLISTIPNNIIVLFCVYIYRVNLFFTCKLKYTQTHTHVCTMTYVLLYIILYHVQVRIQSHTRSLYFPLGKLLPVRFNGTIIGEHGDVDITLDGLSGSSVWITKGIEHACVMMMYRHRAQARLDSEVHYTL